VRGLSDIDASMPNFVTAFLHAMWRQSGDLRPPEQKVEQS
jgi:hypothetical protein